MKQSTRTEHRTIARSLLKLGLLALTSGSALAFSSEVIYDAAGTLEHPAVQLFYPDGTIKEQRGVRTFCSRDHELYEGWVKDVAAIGLKAVGGLVPHAPLPPPDQVRYIDDSGNTIKVYDVEVVLTRDPSFDATVAAIAGNPSGVTFYAYSSPKLGPDRLGNELPLGMHFQPVFEYFSPDSSYKLGQLGDDPYVVLTNTAGTTGGSVVPLTTRLCRTSTPMALESSRVGVPANQDVLRPGLNSAPIIGQTWDPYVLFNGSATDVDFLLVTSEADNVFLPGMGTLLCGGATLIQQQVAHGTPFSVAFPLDKGLLGFPFCAQVGTVSGSNVTLTNALDCVIGAL